MEHDEVREETEAPDEREVAGEEAHDDDGPEPWAKLSSGDKDNV